VFSRKTLRFGATVAPAAVMVNGAHQGAAIVANEMETPPALSGCTLRTVAYTSSAGDVRTFSALPAGWNDGRNAVRLRSSELPLT